ncbi:hypothetical protein SPRG_22050 [Saprolegnia parasitica CBS 223.65]|uniref:glucan endo-1,3-beta-D-glucosidase n=1 Tax=Saprolegnia parasitica (strain CBS 223.65) TaxID=695850 RepID=A0A067D9P4_SAPPC|nr:hypothetical protein SPRG_22050 [Saprolegnia parasitica CBS 223.65]KDO35381.1 hypothetical protein SPRG_22050 [Saprolegnia parasitica CBS 223.65]|eukprot:XP_012194129.1 hypothetical protein SPRG_22050 [Saprolegnia parasitica CBS 223.65]
MQTPESQVEMGMPPASASPTFLQRAKDWAIGHKKIVSALGAVAMIGTVLAVVTASPSVDSATGVSTGANGAGICYDSTENPADLERHFGLIKQKYSSVRTYQVTYGGKNMIDAAAKAGLSIAVGVWIEGGNWDKELQAAIDGTKRHPGSVKAIYIGNEELHKGWGAGAVVDAINKGKSAIRAAGLNVPVGTVQIDGDFLRNPQVADACDSIGVNIYPFFSGPESITNPMGDLNARWSAITKKWGGKARITETGWPSTGGSYNGHHSTYDNAKSYFDKFNDWAGSNGGDTTYYFMFKDVPNKGGYETHFGVMDGNGNWNPTPSPTPEPTTATPEPTTVTPEPTTIEVAFNGSSSSNGTAPSNNSTGSSNSSSNGEEDSLLGTPVTLVPSSGSTPGGASGATPGTPGTGGTGATKAGGQETLNQNNANTGAADDSNGSKSAVSYVLGGMALVGVAAVTVLVVNNRRKNRLLEDEKDIFMSTRDDSMMAVLQTRKSAIAVL